MEQEKAKEAAAQLRETKRNGRNTDAGRNGQNPGTDGRGTNTTIRAGIQDVGGNVATAARNGHTPAGNKRSGTGSGGSFDTSFERTGPTAGRHGEDRVSVSPDSEGSTAGVPAGGGIGNLLADGPKLTRTLEPDKPSATFQEQDLLSKYSQAGQIIAGQPNISVRDLAKALGVGKTTAADVKNAWLAVHPRPVDPKPSLGDQIKGALPFAVGQVLSENEAQQMSGTLPGAIEDVFRVTDEWLWSRMKHVTPGFSEVDKRAVWSDLDEEEIDRLASVILKGGKHNATMAVVARTVNEGRDYIVTGEIVVPRVLKTLDIVKKTHRPPRKRGQQADG